MGRQVSASITTGGGGGVTLAGRHGAGRIEEPSLSSRSAKLIALGLVVGVGAVVAPAPSISQASGQQPPPPTSPPAWQPIEATTFEQRESADPALKPAAENLLVLPFAASVSFLPPRIVAKGERIAAAAEPFRGVARLLPYL